MYPFFLGPALAAGPGNWLAMRIERPDKSGSDQARVDSQRHLFVPPRGPLAG